MNLKEDSAITLEDGNKYWIIKKLEIDNIVFYCTIKLKTPAEVVIFTENGDSLEVVEDENILGLITAEIANLINCPCNIHFCLLILSISMIRVLQKHFSLSEI